MSPDAVDLERRLRVAVGRICEMHRAQWWNTRGQLGSQGGSAVRRGLSRRHHFPQASAVFAVAGYRCAEVFDPPGSVTLWRLPQDIEQAFDARWGAGSIPRAIEDAFFASVAALNGTDLVQALELVSDAAPRHRGRPRSVRGSAATVRRPQSVRCGLRSLSGPDGQQAADTLRCDGQRVDCPSEVWS